MKRQIIGLLALTTALILGCASCESAETTSVGPGQPVTEGNPAIEDAVSIVKDGASAYTVVRSDMAANSSVAVRQSVALRNAIREASGYEIQLATDWVNRGEEMPTDTLEILIGDTNRPESAAAAEGLEKNEYIIRFVGDRLVINAATDEALAMAIDEFIRDALGYDSETGTYAKTDLVLARDYEKKGKYVFHVEAREEAVISTTPKEYQTPTITKTDTMYVQQFDPWDVTGCMTSMQVSCNYSDNINVNSDSVMIYSTSESMVASWEAEEGRFNIDMMIAINRANLDWANSHPASIQTTKSGEKLLHGAKGSYYMVPTEDFIEYIWEDVEWSLKTFRPTTIAFEEPEMWNSSGYSDGFKKEWEIYFGEPWQDPESSPEAMAKSMELKTYLFVRIIGVLSDRIAEIAPQTTFYIATHSTVNYNAWNITAGLNHYMATGKVHGIIGQTWSDTIRTAYAYNGRNVVDEYLNAYIDFTSYVDSVEGTNFYALADPMADSETATEEENRFAYLQTIVASLMRPEIHRFEICPWTDRAFGRVSMTYRTILQQCFNALNEVGGKAITLEAGTPGIAYAVSDTISWLKNVKWAPATSQGMYAITMPLATNGIPVSIKSMEQIYTADDLDDVRILIVSYDNMLPMSETVNEAIADWVKKGGTLLLLSGKNEFWAAEDRFWRADGSPVANLLKKLDVNMTVNTDFDFESTESIVGHGALADAVDKAKVQSTYKRFTFSYNGDCTPLLTLNDETIGFEATCGDGHLIAVSLPSTYYSTAEGCTLMRALTEYATTFAGLDYIETNLMTTRRGSIVATHALRQDDVLTGTYVDLYDELLAVVTDPIVKKKDSRLLFDVATLDLSIPRFAFSGGELVDGSLAESETETTFAYTAALNSTISTRLLAPKGLYPASVKAECDGKTVEVVEIWKNDSSSLLLRIDGAVSPTTVTVIWGTTPVEDGQNVYYKEESVKTNKLNRDKEYLITNTAGVNDGCRYCDLTGELVYQFDIAAQPGVKFLLSIGQNYIVEVSADGTNWTMVADYSEGGTVEHIRDNGNATILSIVPAQYGITETFYFRVRNSNTAMGWGGALTQITWRYPVSAEEAAAMDAAREAEARGEEATEKQPIDESKFLISDKDGVRKYRRTVMTNNKNLDADYLIENSAASNDGIRFCDMMGSLLYYFDLSGTDDFEIAMQVYQNYLIEVSGDNETWIEVADYSEGGAVPHIKDGNNRTTIRVKAADYDLEGKAMYISIRNTDPSQGWGGSITGFTISYTRPSTAE